MATAAEAHGKCGIDRNRKKPGDTVMTSLPVGDQRLTDLVFESTERCTSTSPRSTGKTHTLIT